jgi:predicted CopG family antitoxin
MVLVLVLSQRGFLDELKYLQVLSIFYEQVFETYLSSVYFRYTMMTTIKLRLDTKAKLDALKKDKETYDDIVTTILSKQNKEFIANELKRKYESETDDERRDFAEWEKLD